MSRFCISLACDLVENVPQEVVDILMYMVGLVSVKPANLPTHHFFEDEYWDLLLSDKHLSTFPGDGIATLRRVFRYYRPMSEGRDEVFFYTFSMRCEDKDDGIVAFLGRFS